MHPDFGGLISGVSPVVVRLDVVSFQTSSSTQKETGCWLGGYVLIVLDVSCGVESTIREDRMSQDNDLNSVP